MQTCVCTPTVLTCLFLHYSLLAAHSRERGHLHSSTQICSILHLYLNNSLRVFYNGIIVFFGAPFLCSQLPAMWDMVAGSRTQSPGDRGCPTRTFSPLRFQLSVTLPTPTRHDSSATLCGPPPNNTPWSGSRIRSMPYLMAPITSPSSSSRPRRPWCAAFAPHASQNMLLMTA